ncbi:MAG TPA: DNA polymerase II large subunit [Candidatus Norongarragalinales archaeon]|nr:DNA polymerase II large subunit [Candidatus Norongarragalinales archaeon]
MAQLPVCSDNVKIYFETLLKDFDKAHAVATSAREKGFDPQTKVEIAAAEDLAGRVEGLVGPEGIGARIREILAAEKDRDLAAFTVAREVMEGKFGQRSRDDQLEQALRTALAFYTEGVQCAPLKGEGLSRVKVQKNPDGSEYVALYYAGPIRGAGGAAQGFTAVCADYLRRMAGISNYRATEDETERAVEECNLYSARTRGGQYTPSEEEIRHIMRSCAVCISGEPSEDYEVTKHKNIPSIESNRVRGGFYLVVAEGLCLRATQIIQTSKKAGLEWNWMEKLIKVVKQDAGKKLEVKPVDSYLAEIVAGRPIFTYPMRPGGFSLRYGRTRFTGLAAKAIHPAAMDVLHEFPAFGTQFRIERPGKACIVMPCETIRGPVVLLDDGEVRHVETYDDAILVRGKVKEILALGEMLINYGDFSKFKHPLVPGAWCDEWMKVLLQSKGITKSIQQIKELGVNESFAMAKEFDVPLSPRWTFAWHDLTLKQLQELAKWLATGKNTEQTFIIQGTEGKRALELALVPHKLDGKQVLIENENASAIIRSLGLLNDDGSLSTQKFDEAFKQIGDSPIEDDKESETVMRVMKLASGVTIKRYAGTYIGSRMGRPEKAKERKMQPAVNVLFPIGDYGTKLRSMTRAVKTLKMNDQKLEADLAIKICPECGRKGFKPVCSNCGTRTISKERCLKCDALNEPNAEKCTKCSSTMLRAYEKQVVDLPALFDEAVKKIGTEPQEVKGVVGLFSAQKIPEPLEKGLLRAKHNIAVFRDGTARFDGMEIPITHFIPSEIGISLDRVKQLGYSTDVNGAPIERDDQVIELRAQDMVLPYNGADYFLRVARFVDDLLVYFYGLKPFYNATRQEDLVGQQFIALAPHVSAGSLVRLVGFTKARGVMLHPYVHCAERRNCDGDEIGVLLLMDALLNFSLSYLPETRGGKMDEPLVLTTLVDPGEVDDEVHKMDVCREYPLELFEAAEKIAPAGDVKMDTVAKRLRTNDQYENLNYTHDCLLVGPTETRYIKFKSMRQKVEEELELMMKIRAVDAKNAAERIVLSHFFPDLYGNLHSFSKQNFRCVDCNTIFRRVPLIGKCKKCGGKIILTINRGGIEKYLKLSMDMAEKYALPNYIKQRLQLLEKEINSIFEDDKAKQFSLAEFV